MQNIEIGKKYLTRNGMSVVIARDNGDYNFPLFGEIKTQSGSVDRIAYFTRSGGYSIGRETDFDIVSEINQ